MNTDAHLGIFEQVRTGSSEILRGRHDIDVSAIGPMGRTLLHEAIAFERRDIAGMLLERGVPVDAADQNGQTALHFAGIYSDYEVGKRLLEKGADPNRIDHFGNGPLWSAALARGRDYRLIALLVSKGADPHHKNKAGRSVLDFARQSQNKELWDACSGSAGFEEAQG